MSALSPADGIRCILLKASYTRSAALSRTHLLFGVFGKFRYEIYVIQHNQSGCGHTTMPWGLVSLGSLSKMPVWTLSKPGPNVSFSNKPSEPNYKCEHTLNQTPLICSWLNHFWKFNKKKYIYFTQWIICSVFIHLIDYFIQCMQDCLFICSTVVFCPIACN